MSPEGTDFLYPFIEADERDAGALLTDLAGSAEAKASESARLTAETLVTTSPILDRLAEAMAERMASVGCVTVSLRRSIKPFSKLMGDEFLAPRG